MTHLAEHRRQLVAQAAAQRTALACDLEPWRARLAVADKGISIIGQIGRNPALIAGAVLLFAALRPQRIGKWLLRGWMVWQFGRRLRKG